MKPVAVWWGFVFLGLAFALPARSEPKPTKDGDNYAVRVGSQLDPTQPSKGKLVIQLEGKSPWKINLEAPISIDIRGGEAARLAKSKLRKADRVDPQSAKPRFEVAYAHPAQEVSLQLAFDFVVCNDSLCQKKRFELPFNLSRTPPSVP